MTKSPKVVLKELEDAKKKEGSFLRWGEPQSIGSGRYDISCVFRIAQGNKEIKASGSGFGTGAAKDDAASKVLNILSTQWTQPPTLPQVTSPSKDKNAQKSPQPPKVQRNTIPGVTIVSSVTSNAAGPSRNGVVHPPPKKPGTAPQPRLPPVASNTGNQTGNNSSVPVQGIQRKQNQEGPLQIRTTIDPTEKNGNVVHVSDKVAYYSDSKIGEGSFGAVYKGYLEDPKRAMAVKMMKNEELNNYKSKELDILMTVDHANVIKYYITIKKADFSYIVMDLADTTLHDLVLRRKPKASSYEVLIKLCKDAATGLAELHRRKIIHRDIKPSNVLVFESKNPIPIAKLADFGISRIIGEDKDAFTTKYGNTGTRTFMPPEALNAPTNSPYKLTTYFDIFSLGILIGFAMTEGRNLFSDTKTSGTEQIHANITFYRPNWTIVSSLQLTALKNLLQTMLHKEPQKRSTARCVLEHPFFWGHKEGLMFILGVSNDAKSIGKSKTAKEISLNDELSKTYQRYCSEQIKEGVPITSNWKSRLDENIRNWIQKKDAELQGQKKPQGPKGWRMYKENSLVELVNFIRDQNEHTENWVTEKEVTRPDLFGRQGSNYGPYFLKTFPELTTLLYTLLQDPQLRNAQTVHTNLFYSENTNICFQNWRPLK